MADAPRGSCPTRAGTPRSYQLFPEEGETGTHKRCRTTKATFLAGERVISPRPHEQLDVRNDLPTHVFWGDVDGVNYLTETQDPLSAILRQLLGHGNHRVVVRSSKSLATPRSQRFSRSLRRCSSTAGRVVAARRRSCAGLHGTLVAPEIDETCQAYEARDGKCKPMGICEDCAPGQPQPFLPGTCKPVKRYKRWTLSEYGHVHGGLDVDAVGWPVSNAEKMKAELATRSPMRAAFTSPTSSTANTRVEYTPNPTCSNFMNHELAVVGYEMDEASGEEYWIGRNSWGTYWGESGFFRIKMHHQNLGIESDCTFGVPVAEPEEREPEQLMTHGVKDEPSANQKNRLFSINAFVKKGTYHDYDRPCRLSPPSKEVRELVVHEI